MQLSNHTEWKQRSIEDAETFNLIYYINDNGIECFENKDCPECKWKMWRGSDIFTVALFKNGKYQNHEFHKTKIGAIHALLSKKDLTKR